MIIIICLPLFLPHTGIHYTCTWNHTQNVMEMHVISSAGKVKIKTHTPKLPVLPEAFL